MNCYIGAARFKVDVDLIKENPKTVLVRLPDGHLILRDKERDFDNYEQDKLVLPKPLDVIVPEKVKPKHRFKLIKKLFNKLIKKLFNKEK